MGGYGGYHDGCGGGGRDALDRGGGGVSPESFQFLNESTLVDHCGRGTTDANGCPPQEGDPDISRKKSRGNWASKWEFFFSCLGFSVGLGNVWRFPYLAYANGGGAFLIPYLVMLFLAGKPMYFMELAFGQFAGTSPLTIWSCAPIAKGVGVAMVLLCWILSVYYNVIMSYTLYFATFSVQKTLPWTVCDSSWTNETNCAVRSKDVVLTSNNTATVVNGTRPKIPSQVFWERKVLDISGGIDELGGVKMDLAICLFCSWVIVTLCLTNGVKSSGKIAYFATTFPFMILVTLLVVGLCQEGAWDGVWYLIVPDYSKLLSIHVWQAAASQMFFSLGISLGCLIMYTSYNDFRHNIFRDAIVVSGFDTLVSVTSSVVIFSVLGAMAHELKVDIKDVVESGPGLAFVAYPEALSRLPFPQVWSFLFFIMLFTLGLTTEFACLESVLTSLADQFYFLRLHKRGMTVIVGVISFGIGLLCVTRAGQYFIEILDSRGLSLPLLAVGVFECFAVAWIYGYNNFLFDVNFMLRRKLGLYWKFTWKYSSILVLLFISMLSYAQHRPLTYGDYTFPQWAQILGWCIMFFVIGQIPFWAILAIVKEKGSIAERISSSSTARGEWGPKDPKLKTEWLERKERLKIAIIQH